uniref:BPTI/Kunitz inhibitor domain-containing protein n=1 Tax=Romanomermis culicivorax TaxID=13658 RepID=A0A915K3R8_ROMCU
DNNPCPNGSPLTDQHDAFFVCSSPNDCLPGYWCHFSEQRAASVCCPGAFPFVAFYIDKRKSCFGLEPEMGVGHGSLTRWYYDFSSLDCKKFTYRGSKGNQNNFMSREQCEATCKDVQQSPCTSFVEDRIYCSPSSANCPSKYYCHLGDTPETSICCPKISKNPCDLPLSEGSGNAAMARFFYDSQENRCSPFRYRGLFGNENNF